MATMLEKLPNARALAQNEDAKLLFCSLDQKICTPDQKHPLIINRADGRVCEIYNTGAMLLYAEYSGLGCPTCPRNRSR